MKRSFLQEPYVFLDSFSIYEHFTPLTTIVIFQLETAAIGVAEVQLGQSERRRMTIIIFINPSFFSYSEACYLLEPVPACIG